MNNDNLNINLSSIKENLLKAIGISLTIFLIVLSISSLVGIVNQVREGRYIGQGVQNKNTINVSGEGRVFVAPDIAQVNLSVVSESKTVAVAQKDSVTKMNKVIQAMKDLKIDDKDLKTINYSVSPKYIYTFGKNEISGYIVTQTLRVKIRDLEKISSVLDKGIALGANQVGSLEFTVNDQEKSKQEARQEAITNAKQKAEILASKLGVSLGKVVSYNENEIGNPKYYYSDAMGGMGGGGATSTVQPGENEILINAYITFEIY